MNSLIDNEAIRRFIKTGNIAKIRNTSYQISITANGDRTTITLNLDDKLNPVLVPFILDDCKRTSSRTTKINR